MTLIGSILAILIQMLTCFFGRFKFACLFLSLDGIVKISVHGTGDSQSPVIFGFGHNLHRLVCLMNAFDGVMKSGFRREGMNQSNKIQCFSVLLVSFQPR